MILFLLRQSSHPQPVLLEALSLRRPLWGSFWMSPQACPTVVCHPLVSALGRFPFGLSAADGCRWFPLAHWGPLLHAIHAPSKRNPCCIQLHVPRLHKTCFVELWLESPSGALSKVAQSHRSVRMSSVDECGGCGVGQGGSWSRSMAGSVSACVCAWDLELCTQY